jgi:hypothetical protein
MAARKAVELRVILCTILGPFLEEPVKGGASSEATVERVEELHLIRAIDGPRARFAL